MYRAVLALVDDDVASDCGVVRGAGSSLPVIHAVDVSAVAFNQRRASFLLGLVAPSTIACLSSALSLVLWEKLFGGCLAGGHFFAGTIQYCSVSCAQSLSRTIRRKGTMDTLE
jgi:hypothetical protein